MQDYNGEPEFELFNRENFNVTDESELPQITMMSNTEANELIP